MQTITITYALKWQLDFAPHVCFTQKGECFNVKLGRQLKRSYRGVNVGFWIGNTFYPLPTLRQHLVKTGRNKTTYPF